MLTDVKSRIKLDITGQRFGRLVALRPDENDIRYWWFECDCGTVKRINRNSVTKTNRSTKSCGCLKKEQNKINLGRETIFIEPGMKFGRLTAIEPIKVGTRTQWLFKCDCGNKIQIEKHIVVSGHTQSCGCLLRDMYDNGDAGRKYPDDITGKKFWKLTAVKPIRNYKGKPKGYWLFKCECGTEKIIDRNQVFSGSTKSCGCHRKVMVLDNKKVADKKRVELKTSCYYSNLLNGIPSKRNKSGCVGVSYDKTRNKWKADIMFMKKRYNLGRFENKEDAIAVRKEAEKRIRGPFLEWYNQNYKNTIA